MDSFPPSEREWLVKLLRESEQRQTDKLLMLNEEFKGVEERLGSLESALFRTGKRASLNSTLNGGAILSAAVTVLFQLAQQLGWM